MRDVAFGLSLTFVGLGLGALLTWLGLGRKSGRRRERILYASATAVSTLIGLGFFAWYVLLDEGGERPETAGRILANDGQTVLAHSVPAAEGVHRGLPVRSDVRPCRGIQLRGPRLARPGARGRQPRNRIQMASTSLPPWTGNCRM